ncbi:hypothetical protein O181_036998 [Austropuccinia psidii MF-1]|uniref:Uncharacterized protein n=1 Tax=Austropuccinia psidii MF-1 TaxID=1389203 RepID=A0A9Q3D8I2_9BASI|nr:hypothetical protein [Austropuccinia psidii MF-1]
MEHGQQEVQPSIPLGRKWSKFPEDMSQSDRLQRPYGSFQEKTRIQGQKQDLFQPKAERVRPNDPEAVRLGERGTQEQETVVHTSRICSPINRNFTLTQIEQNVVTPESSLKSNSLWLQMSQFAEQTQKQFAELQASHERMETLTASMDTIVKTFQEGNSQLRMASAETNKGMNKVFEEQHHSKRDRDCLDQEINKMFNVYANMKPQPQGHFMDNPYHQEDIKPDAKLVNQAISPSQYQDRDNMSYYETEALKQLPEASSWPTLPGTEEYHHMKLIDYIHGLFIDVQSIPDYWLTARLNIAFKGHASIWYTEMKEIHFRRNWPLWKTQIIQKYSNGCLRQFKRLKAIDPQLNIQMKNHKLLPQIPGELKHAVKCICKQNCTLDDIANTLQDIRKRTNIRKYSPYKSSSFKEKQSFRVGFKEERRERVAEVTKKKNSCQNCGSTDPYVNNCPKEKKSMPLGKSQRRNPQQRILDETLWVMPLENNLMNTKTKERNFWWNTKKKHH